MNLDTTNQDEETPFLFRLYLWIAIWLHIVGGLFTLFMIFPRSDRVKKEIHIKRWSEKLLKIFGIHLVINNASILPARPILLASNHISWMDIHAINAFAPIRFVAKSEVESWPIFGWMAKQLGTVFIERTSAKHAHLVVGNMSQTLKTESICIFPEGTSTDGETVRPFKPNLFEAAVTSKAPVYTLAIRYVTRGTGKRSDVPAFIGEMGLLESMSKMLKKRNVDVELSFFPPAGSSPHNPNDRKWLALHSYEQIANFLGASEL
jgi:1-acyl-sn-glycerol-3-phosphate acyltransferase